MSCLTEIQIHARDKIGDSLEQLLWKQLFQDYTAFPATLDESQNQFPIYQMSPETMHLYPPIIDIHSSVPTYNDHQIHLFAVPVSRLDSLDGTCILGAPFTESGWETLQKFSKRTDIIRVVSNLSPIDLFKNLPGRKICILSDFYHHPLLLVRTFRVIQQQFVFPYIPDVLHYIYQTYPSDPIQNLCRILNSLLRGLQFAESGVVAHGISCVIATRLGKLLRFHSYKFLSPITHFYLPEPTTQTQNTEFKQMNPTSLHQVTMANDAELTNNSFQEDGDFQFEPFRSGSQSDSEISAVAAPAKYAVEIGVRSLQSSDQLVSRTRYQQIRRSIHLQVRQSLERSRVVDFPAFVIQSWQLANMNHPQFSGTNAAIFKLYSGSMMISQLQHVFQLGDTPPDICLSLKAFPRRRAFQSLATHQTNFCRALFAPLFCAPLNAIAGYASRKHLFDKLFFNSLDHLREHFDIDSMQLPDGDVAVFVGSHDLLQTTPHLVSLQELQSRKVRCHTVLLHGHDLFSDERVVMLFD